MPLELDARERQIMDLVCLGKTDAEIGMILGLAETTIKKHVRTCLVKMDSSRRTLAAVRYDRKYHKD